MHVSSWYHIRQSLLPHMTFVFYSSSTILAYGNPSRKNHGADSCIACGKDVKGYHYRSLGGNMRLHPCCAFLPLQLTCAQTQNLMQLQPKTTNTCFYCGEKKVKVNNHRTDQLWSYCSPYENAHIHVPCVMQMISDKFSSVILHMEKKENGVARLKLQLATTRHKWEQRLTTFIKYVKVVSGAIGSAFFGDFPSFIVNSYMAINS